MMLRKPLFLLLCTVLALSLCLFVLPKAAMAKTPTGVWVSNKDVSAGGCWIYYDALNKLVPASNTNYNVCYDPGTKTLTLKNVTIRAHHTFPGTGDTTFSAAIYADKTLTIDLIGENKLTGATGQNSAGIYINDISSTLTINSSSNGSLEATGANATFDSYGVFSRDEITILGGTLNATGGDAGGDSYGVCGSSVNISGGTVKATGGTANVTDGDAAGYSYGVRGTIVTISGGTVNATGGTANKDSSGFYATTVNIDGGTVTANGGTANNDSSGFSAATVNIDGGMVTANGSAEGSGSYGVHGNKLNISAGTVEAKGTKSAFSKDPDLDSYPAPRTITIDDDFNGASPTTTEGTPPAYTSYKYFKIVLPRMSIAGQGMTATAGQPGYYTNGPDGAAGAVADTEPANWNAMLEFTGGKYKLTVKDLNLHNTPGGIASGGDLDLHILGEQFTISLSDASNRKPAIFVDGDLNITCEGDDKKSLTARANNSTAVKVNGNLTLVDACSLSSTADTNGRDTVLAIDVKKNLTLEKGSSILATTVNSTDAKIRNTNRGAKVVGNVVINGLSMECRTDSGIGLEVGGNIVMNGLSMECLSNNGHGLEVGGSLTLNSGYSKFSGSGEYRYALNREPNFGDGFSYIWTTDKTTYNQAPYTYNYKHQYLGIMPISSAVISDVTVSGTVHSPISAQDATITLNKAAFKYNLAAGDDVSGWFNIPAGISAKLINLADENRVATVTFSGTPTAASTAAMAVTVSANSIIGNTALTVTTNANAMWSIAPAPGGSSGSSSVTVCNAPSPSAATIKLSGSGLTSNDLLITEREPQGSAYNALLKLADSDNVFNTYNIYLRSGKKSTGSAMNLTFDLDSKYAGQAFTLVHQKADGTYEYFYDTADYFGDLSFGPLYELSPFMLVHGKLAQTAYANFTDMPKTGDSAQPALWASIVLLMAVASLAGISLCKRRG